MFLLSILLTVYPLLVLGTAVLFVYKKRRIAAHHRRLAIERDGTVTLAIFHPYANGGGGGERVLYCLLDALARHVQQKQANKRHLRVLLYAGDDGLNVHELLQISAERFNLPELVTRDLANMITMVPLTKRYVLEPARYPSFTLFWQSVAQIRLAWEAFSTSEKMGEFPDIFVDTTGCPFSYVVASVLYGCKVCAYVHYPMISTDMISAVQQRDAAFNNDASIAKSPSRSLLKSIYYRLFALAYGAVGHTCTDVVMVNSTWTFNHIRTLWGKAPTIVYPPCGDIEAQSAAGKLTSREPIALSIAQFRPEKNLALQLQAFHVLRTQHREELQKLCPKLELVLLGSCRNADDEARVEALRELCADLDLTSCVKFVVNASYAELKGYLARSSIGLHTMHNEHFGISVVEMMAAGLIVVANNSGGPKADIVKPGTGFLAQTAEEYADAVLQVLRMMPEEVEQMQTSALESSRRFSDQEFSKQCLDAMVAPLEL